MALHIQNGNTNGENDEDRHLVRAWLNDHLIEDGGTYTEQNEKDFKTYMETKCVTLMNTDAFHLYIGPHL